MEGWYIENPSRLKLIQRTSFLNNIIPKILGQIVPWIGPWKMTFHRIFIHCRIWSKLFKFHQYIIYSRRQQIRSHFKTSLTSQKLLLAPEKLCTLRTHIHKVPVTVVRIKHSQNQCYVRYHTKLIYRISEFFAIFFEKPDRFFSCLTNREGVGRLV